MILKKEKQQVSIVIGQGLREFGFLVMSDATNALDANYKLII